MKVLLAAGLLACPFATGAAIPAGQPRESNPARPRISKNAAESCALKVTALEEYAGRKGRKKQQTTRISEEEINSYLALELSAKYHPSLKSIVVSLEEAKMQGTAAINFDEVNMNSARFVKKLLARMFAGEHELSVKGRLITNSGKANFQVHEARFDGTSLPIFLVEEIMSIVGRKQKPPIDPILPSQMPYGIQKVDLHPGYILIHQ